MPSRESFLCLYCLPSHERVFEKRKYRQLILHLGFQLSGGFAVEIVWKQRLIQTSIEEILRRKGRIDSSEMKEVSFIETEDVPLTEDEFKRMDRIDIPHEFQIGLGTLE